MRKTTQKGGIDALVHRRVVIIDEDQEDSVEQAKSELKQACDDVVHDSIEGHEAFVNSTASDILKELAELRRGRLVDQAKIKDIEEATRINGMELARLRINDDEKNRHQQEVLATRRRTLDCYRRDVLELDKYVGSPAIKAGNIVAHEGNAMTDAFIFESDKTIMDHGTYSRIYGLTFQQVLRYREDNVDGGIFIVINTYGTCALQSWEKEIPLQLEKVFRDFITRAENVYPKTPLNNEADAALRKLYWEFWAVHREWKKAESRKKGKERSV